MGPPPKPPVICYELRASANARRRSHPQHRVPAQQRARVTMVQKDIDDYESRPRPRPQPQPQTQPRQHQQKLLIPNRVRFQERENAFSSGSSTISISSCSSLNSNDEPIVKFARAPQRQSKSIQTSFLTIPRTTENSPETKDFSFFKGSPTNYEDTLEVTDLDFFDKIEDKTMIEVNELFEKMQSIIRDLEEVATIS